MNRKILIRDLTIRDGQQSQFATRMNQKQVDRVLPFYKDANFYAAEVWGGAVPDSVMRFLNEDPWERLDKVKKGFSNNTKLTALSRGRNIFGYNPYPEDVIEGFNRLAVKSGIDIMRIFDALNDLNNMKSTIKYVKANGGMADCAVCYTVDPRFSLRDRVKGFFGLKKIPGKIFTIDYFVEKSKELEKLGADIISIKDMAGLIPPDVSAELTKRLKKEVNVPIDLHTHCTPGYGLASVLNAIVNGADIVDTVINNFAGGPAAPSFELIQVFCDKLKIDTGVNLDAVAKINKELKEIRKELANFDQIKIFPIDFDISNYSLPNDINALFDKAIEASKANRHDELMHLCWDIEKYFNFPAPDEAVKNAEIPGGMYTNMLSQLKQANLSHMFSRVLEVVPVVRLASGLPPLVTPTSQIVGVQAVYCVVDESKGKPFYDNTSTQYVNLVKGVYGKTPYPVDEEFRLKISGTRTETPYDVSKYMKQDNPKLKEFEDVRLAADEKEELLLELFPAVATTFLKGKREVEYKKMLAGIAAQEEIEKKRIEEEAEKYQKLSEDEKHEILMEGLYNNW
ncbi:MAG TPA: carboxylase [Ignavibacteria bacterium]|nr:carboxylase [Ignavibacteria bacterium]